MNGLSQEHKTNRAAFGQQLPSFRKSLRPSTKSCQTTALKLCSKVETMARVSISELYQFKPIAFRWTSTSSAHDQLFFGYPGRSEETSWEKSHEAWRLIRSTSNTESSLFFTSPGIPNRTKNQPSIIMRSILDFRLTTHYHVYPHLLSIHGQKSWSQYDGQF